MRTRQIRSAMSHATCMPFRAMMCAFVVLKNYKLSWHTCTRCDDKLCSLSPPTLRDASCRSKRCLWQSARHTTDMEHGAQKVSASIRTELFNIKNNSHGIENSLRQHYSLVRIVDTFNRAHKESRHTHTRISFGVSAVTNEIWSDYSTWE